MKRILTAAAIAIAFTASSTQAEELSLSAPVRQRPAALTIELKLTATFPTLPDAPRFTAKGSGPLSYSIMGKEASLIADSIPAMTFESEGPLGGVEKLSVVATIIPGTKPLVNWFGYPTVVMKSVDLRVRAYRGSLPSSPDGMTPLIDTVLENLSFSTDRIDVEGIESQGYIDMEGPGAQLVGTATLPEDPNPLYSEWLAGEPVILELEVNVANPYGR